jgi:hypothetical protein
MGKAMNTEMVVLPVFAATLGFVIWMLVNGWQRRQQLKLTTEFNSRLLDRVGSVKDLSLLLETEGGAKLIGALTAGPRSLSARERIVSAVQMGVVFVTLGAGFLFLGGQVALDVQKPFHAIGVIMLSLGIGLLGSSIVSFRLARSLGLLDAGEADAEP